MAQLREVDLRGGEQRADAVLQLERKPAAFVLVHGVQVTGQFGQVLGAACHLVFQPRLLVEQRLGMAVVHALQGRGLAQHQQQRQQARQCGQVDADTAAAQRVQHRLAFGVHLLPLGLRQLLGEAAHRIHGDARIGRQQLVDALGLAGVEGLHRLGQGAKALLGLLAQRHHAGLHGTVVRVVRVEPVEPRRGIGRGLLVGVEVNLAPGQQVAALAGLGVEQATQHELDLRCGGGALAQARQGLHRSLVAGLVDHQHHRAGQRDQRPRQQAAPQPPGQRGRRLRRAPEPGPGRHGAQRGHRASPPVCIGGWACHAGLASGGCGGCSGG